MITVGRILLVLGIAAGLWVVYKIIEALASVLAEILLRTL